MINSRKIISLLAFLSALAWNQNSYADIADGFIFQPAMTVELQGINTSGSGRNDKFTYAPIKEQIKNFDDIALGLNFRVHQYLGFNINWAKAGLQNNGLNGYNVNNKANLNIENFNASSLIYFPIIGDHWLEGFAEIGIADVHTRVRFTTTDGGDYNTKSRQNVLLYGGGIQLAPYDSGIAFRFGIQQYQTRMGTLDLKMTTYRGGVVLPF